MTLSSLKAPIRRQEVQVNDEESLLVRGLNPADVIALYIRHTGEASAMFERLVGQWQANGNKIVGTDVLAIALDLLQHAPNVLAELLAIGFGGDPADERAFAADIAIARDLPFGVQGDAFNKICGLTFTSDMPPGKFAALITEALSKVTGAFGKLSPEALTNGSGNSASR